MTKAVMIHGQAIVFRVEPTGSIEAPGVDYILYADSPISETTRQAATDRIRFFLSLDDDLQAFYALVPPGDPFQAVVDKLYGYRQVKFLTPFENSCWAILTQRNRIPAAQKMKRALVEAYGGKLTVQDTTYWAFPEASALANIDQETLAALIAHNQKAQYLLAAARAFNTVDESFLRTGNYESVLNWLLNIKGIGAWSAAFVMIRGLGRMERPVTEKALAAAASACYGRPVSEQALAEIAAVYVKYQGYCAHYLRAAS